jgi:tryptophan synthase beta subunit
MYGGKFGGNFIPETLKKPIDDLTKLFAKLRKDKKFLKERDHYFKTYIGTPTPFIKLENLKGYKDHLKIKKFIDKVNELKN